MKKIITIIIIVILALGLGYYLFKVSGGTQGTGDTFDLSKVQPTDKIRDVGPDEHVLGNAEAKNVMIAFEDIQCPACKNYESTLKAFPSELKDTKVVFRHFPLVNAHKNAAAAAYAAEAASAQGKFWEWTALAYQRQESWSVEKNPAESFVAIAQAAGVSDLEKFRNEAVNKTYRERVQRDVQEGVALNVRGTPSLYFNGVQLELTGIEGIKKQVEKFYK
ncbi:MAG: thioredoxin domain-containing protein [Candidatus Doudnabacteria bacterium]|nr:thioredoxin domain-containing protein [Candidatus Doudnabacteria bacterium]